MKDKLPEIVEQGRIKNPKDPCYSNSSYGRNGFFAFKIKGQEYYVICSDGSDWDHISVSKPKKRIPTWKEMCMLKDLFFKEDEWVVQYHPAKSKYVNVHSGVLHLWRCQNQDFITPPIEFV